MDCANIRRPERRTRVYRTYYEYCTSRFQKHPILGAFETCWRNTHDSVGYGAPTLCGAAWYRTCFAVPGRVKCHDSAQSTAFHYKGPNTPPTDMKAYGAVVKGFIEAMVDYFGIEEVSSWAFEVYK